MPLAHGLALSPSGEWLVAVDAGQAHLVVLRFSESSGTLSVAHSYPQPPPKASGRSCLQTLLVRGIGHRPRHAAFGVDGRTLFVVHEGGNALCIHAFDTTTGTIARARQTLPLAGGTTGGVGVGGRCGLYVDAPAEVAVHAASGSVLASVRGLNAPSRLAAFRGAERGGSGRSGGSGNDAYGRSAEHIVGSNPRHFCLDSSQHMLLLGTAGAISVYDVANDDGSLSLRACNQLGPCDEAAKARGKPVDIDCIAIVPRRG